MTYSISFKRDSVTIIRPNYVTERGDLVKSWTGATEHTETGWRVQPLVGDEVLGDRDAVVRRWKGLGPPAADITEMDRVRHAGIVYEVDGAVQRWPSPTGLLAHTEVTLKLVEG